MYSHSKDHPAQMHVCNGSRTSFAPRTSLHPRVMSHTLLHTSSPSLSSTSLVLLSSSPNPDLFSTCPIIHCEDPRQDVTSTEYHPPQVMSAKGSTSTGFWSNHQIKQLTTKMICQKVDLQPISSRLGRKHCDAARLGPRRRAIT